MWSTSMQSLHAMPAWTMTNWIPRLHQGLVHISTLLYTTYRHHDHTTHLRSTSLAHVDFHFNSRLDQHRFIDKIKRTGFLQNMHALSKSRHNPLNPDRSICTFHNFLQNEKNTCLLSPNASRFFSEIRATNPLMFWKIQKCRSPAAFVNSKTFMWACRN